MNRSFITLLFFFIIVLSCRQEPELILDNRDDFYIKKAKQWTELSLHKLRESGVKESEAWIKDWGKARGYN